MNQPVDPPRGEPGEGPPDTRPYLCVPYWTAPLSPGGGWDTGQVRPLPGSVVGYLCESIHPGPYQPGQPLDVRVSVRNSGGGNAAALATVVVYWADPTVGFAKPNFFAASVVSVPPSRTAPAVATTPTMTATIPATAPAHVCLVVAVSHPQDRAGTVCDPAGDRHWAQRNLQAATVAPGAPALLPLTVANPLATEGAFEVRVGPASSSHAALVGREVGTVPADAAATVRLLDAEGGQAGEGGREARLSLGLGPHESRQFQVLVEVADDLPAGRSLALEAALLGDDGERTLGSLGTVLLAPQD
ncbi:hypothetical protein [Kitasatospora sp. NPDC059571]|uniref:hypothetical protein n=1 Tax=Kitasatospora sp. NPDC059571 TaxID=3346871 RepID=UPI0036A272E4